MLYRMRGSFWFFQGTNRWRESLFLRCYHKRVATMGATVPVAQGIIANNTLYLFYNNKIVTVSLAGQCRIMYSPRFLLICVLHRSFRLAHT